MLHISSENLSAASILQGGSDDGTDSEEESEGDSGDELAELEEGVPPPQPEQEPEPEPEPAPDFV